MMMDDGIENFLNNNSGPLMQKAWEPLVSVKWKSLSHTGTEAALCLYKRGYNPCDCGTTCTYGILLAIPGFLQIMCFKGTKKKSWLFPCISYILFPFIHFKSHCQAPGNKQFKSHLLPKSNWRSQKKKKDSSLSCRADHIVLTHSCAATHSRLGTHRHIPSCAWIYYWLWKPIYPVAMNSTV